MPPVGEWRRGVSRLGCSVGGVLVELSKSEEAEAVEGLAETLFDLPSHALFTESLVSKSSPCSKLEANEK